MPGDDVIVPESQVENQGGEPETPQPPTDGKSKQGEPSNPDNPEGGKEPGKKVDTDYQSENENLKKALKIEREKYRKLVQGKRQGNQGYSEDEELQNNPEYQNVVLENATYKLKEGAEGILRNYPQLPKAVARAISKNPRGFVNYGTRDIETALLDIEEYIIGYLEENEAELQQPNGGVKPKPAQIANTNKGGDSEKNIESEIAEIEKLPPEEWTDEQEKKVTAYLKSKKK